MIYADLHCDTATEMYKQGIGFDSALHVSKKQTKDFEKVYQCFAVFSDDSSPISFGTFKCVAADLLKKLENEKSIVPLLTVEGGSVIDGDLKLLDELKRMDVRAFGLVWNGKNALATGAKTDDRAPLTELGRECVKRLEELGIFPDVSHLSQRGFFDVAECSEGVLVATHSNCRAVCDHPRNLTDEQIRIIIERKGLMGINLYPFFLGKDADISTVLAHIEHVLSLGGEDALAFGCDFDGVDCLPRGIHGAADVKTVGEEVSKRFSDRIAEKLLYKNFFKVFGITEK